MTMSRFLSWLAFGLAVAVILMMVSYGTGFGSTVLTLIKGDWLVLIAGLGFIYTYASLGSVKALEQARFTALAQSGLVAALLSFIACLLLLFYGFRLPPVGSILLSKAIVTGTIWALWCGQFTALYRRRKASVLLHVARGATLLFATALGGPVIWVAWWERIDLNADNEMFVLISASLLLLTVVGVIACRVIRGTQSLEDQDETFIENRLHRQYAAVCPRCEKTQYFMTGESHCSQCQLRISVIVP